MRRIKEQAAQLHELDEQYILFAHELRTLAQSFEDEKLVELLRRYLSETNKDGEAR